MLVTVIKETLAKHTYVYLGVILGGILFNYPLFGVSLVLSSITLIIVILNIANYILNNPRG